MINILNYYSNNFTAPILIIVSLISLLIIYYIHYSYNLRDHKIFALFLAPILLLLLTSVVTFGIALYLTYNALM